VSVPLHVHGKAARPFSEPVIGRVTSGPIEDAGARRDHVLRLVHPRDAERAIGHAGLLTLEPPSPGLRPRLGGSSTVWIHSLRYLDHLADGDVVSLHPNGYVRTLYRAGSPHNAIFATDRCNSWCLMCSQPPRPVDDDGRIREHLRLIELIDPSCRELGITGGEPTLMKDDLLLLIERCRDLLPETALHVLSNGRLFYYGSFARKLAAIGHSDLMIGVPLYSAINDEHDHVVQAKGAYDQTIVGLQNLARHRVAVEIRVVVHRLTYRNLGELAELVYRNLPFAAHVTFMGLEMMGFAVPNADRLWIDPFEYRTELEAAVLYLASAGMSVSIYNHQLCVTPPSLWSYCRKSISDWKNDYLPECRHCAVRERCGGFFASSLKRRRSDHIAPLGLGELAERGPEGIERSWCIGSSTAPVP
jgi:His-Xaa-Ser system radical SAM maturase HxsC